MKDNILVLLHDFLNQFLSGGYNGIFSEFNVLFYIYIFCFYFFFTTPLIFNINQMHISSDADNL